MILEEKKYKIKELAEWFQTSPENFSKYREKKLEELRKYCDFIDKGRQGIVVTRVHTPEYMGKTRKLVESMFKEAWGDNPGSLKRAAKYIWDRYAPVLNIKEESLYAMVCKIKREWYGVPHRNIPGGLKGYCNWVYAVVKDDGSFRYLTEEEETKRHQMFSVFFKDGYKRVEAIAALNKSRELGEITDGEFTDAVLEINGMCEKGDWDSFNRAFMLAIGEDCDFALELIDRGWENRG